METVKTFFCEFQVKNLKSFKMELTKNLLFLAAFVTIGALVSFVHCLIIGNTIMSIVAALIFFSLVIFFAKLGKTKFFINLRTYESDEMGSEF